MAASVKALDLRYALLPQLYTFMVTAHLRGTPVARPLFFNFPQDGRGYNVAESEFMLGDSLLVAPVLEEVSEKYNTTSSAHISKSKSYFQPYRVPQT